MKNNFINNALSGKLQKGNGSSCFAIRNMRCNIAILKKGDKIKKFMVNVINKKFFVSNCIAELVIIGE